MRTATIQEIQDNLDLYIDLAQTEPIGIIDESGEVTTVLLGIDLYVDLGGKLDDDGKSDNP